MVAQPAAAMAAGSSSGEEAAAGTGPAPQEIQEQAAPSMMEMLALLVEKVGGIQDAVDQVSARTGALELGQPDSAPNFGLDAGIRCC